MMTNGDHKGRIIFLANQLIPHLILEKMKNTSRENFVYAEMRQSDVSFTMTSRINVRSACGCLFFIFH